MNILMLFSADNYVAAWRNGHWKTYDPTNGTVSLGFIYRIQGGGDQ